MIITNLIVAFLFTYYTFYATDLFDDRKRKEIKQKNTKLDSYRRIPIKTIEQQKEFLKIKQPQKKFKWNQEAIVEILYRIVMYIIFVNIYLWAFGKSIFTWWQTILIVILIPLFVNIILERFGLQISDSITVFFRGGKNSNNRQKTRRQKTGK